MQIEYKEEVQNLLEFIDCENRKDKCIDKVYVIEGMPNLYFKTDIDLQSKFYEQFVYQLEKIIDKKFLFLNIEKVLYPGILTNPTLKTIYSYDIFSLPQKELLDLPEIKRKKILQCIEDAKAKIEEYNNNRCFIDENLNEAKFRIDREHSKENFCERCSIAGRPELYTKSNILGKSILSSLRAIRLALLWHIYYDYAYSEDDPKFKEMSLAKLFSFQLAVDPLFCTRAFVSYQKKCLLRTVVDEIVKESPKSTLMEARDVLEIAENMYSFIENQKIENLLYAKVIKFSPNTPKKNTF